MSSTPHPNVDWSSKNLPEAWKKFKQHVRLMFMGPLKKATQAEQCAYLLIWAGEKGRDIYNTFTVTEQEAASLNSVLDKFDSYVTPKSSSLFARYQFQTRIQHEGETIEQFTTDLQLLVQDCAYDKPQEMVRDRIVCGILHSKVREKLLDIGDTLDMTKAIDVCRSHEITQSHLKSMSSSKAQPQQSLETVDAISKFRHKHTDRSQHSDANRNRRQDPANVCATRENRQTQQKRFYDRTAKPLPDLQHNDKVYVQKSDNNKSWTPGIISSVLPHRSYLVRTSDDQTYRRNRRHIKQRSSENGPEHSIQLNNQKPEANSSIPSRKKSSRTITKPKKLDI
ncbi:uncharacterized protein LOC130013006 [Patella vulgata]|uniref:uncharacterized protein LOC126809726 n=1 Tax=Patella vulgata TaxID=6465 RepID=UPI0021805C39|nr:uncharacterized protein LOC126809726 [Patella vulgata]XP_050404654.1 uncharacterized protein LOC126820616 [Patella vulgata]XP_055954722.1 uncharacterized protein LOC130010749 [Patella vulgata]XP_055957315.1 uncharacterized protein LOC130013006 [Patella vulgata]